MTFEKMVVFPRGLAHDVAPRMNISLLPSRSYRQEAFTLIELLVVITIIAVLAGLLLPVGQKVLENAKKVSAKSTETQIISAVNSYQTEYGQYPVYFPAGTNTTDITFGVDNTYPSNALFNVLRAINTVSADPTVPTLNSRRIVYFESKNVKNVATPRDGFMPPGAAAVKGNPNAAPVVSLNQGDLVDPWGNPYLVMIDSNYTNVLVNPYSKGNALKSNDSDDPANPPLAGDNTVIRTGVIAWSLGNDGQVGNAGVVGNAPYAPAPGDDVDSWQ